MSIFLKKISKCISVQRHLEEWTPMSDIYVFTLKSSVLVWKHYSGHEDKKKVLADNEHKHI